LIKRGKQPRFSDSVYKFTSLIPKGKVTTYGALAKALGSPRAGRATGNALGANPNPIDVVPCHRVVRSDGSIGGYSGSGGRKTKERLLKKEGVVVVAGKVNLDRFLFTSFKRN
jgi:methylated-DNA-[protein]-cysteine S-methyltransferase